MGKPAPGRPVAAALLDTSFLITLLDRTRKSHATAVGCFRLWTASGVVLYASTIVIAEYTARGALHDYILRWLRILPFGYHHAIKSGSLTAAQIAARDGGTWPASEESRYAVRNDVKLFAQAHESGAALLATDDRGMMALAGFFKERGLIGFDILPPWLPFDETMALGRRRG